MDVIVKKSKYAGWEAMTRIDLPGLRTAGQMGDDLGIAKLEINTYKALVGIRSVARVCFHRNDGGIVHAMAISEHGSGDFYHTLLIHNSRATEQAIRRMHDKALLQAEALVEKAKAFYAAREA